MGEEICKFKLNALEVYLIIKKWSEKFKIKIKIKL